MRSPEINNQPTPHQLFELAGLCMDFGKAEKNSLRTNRRSSVMVGGKLLGNKHNAKSFKSDFLSPPDQTYYDWIFGNPSSLSRQFDGRVTLQRHRYWDLQLKETCMFFEGGDLIDQFHIQHRFKWTGSTVLEALRSLHVVDVEEDYGESYQIPDLDSGIYQPDLIHADNQMRTVSGLACEVLMNTIRSFNESLHAEPVQGEHNVVTRDFI